MDGGQILVPMSPPGHARPQGRRTALMLALATVALLAVLPWTSTADGAATPNFVSAPQVALFRAADAATRLPEPLRADPNQWGLLRPLEKKRAPRKPPFISLQLLNKITRMNKEGVKETIQCWNRASTIIPAMIGHTIALHNGRDFIPVSINEGMVGYKLGDFVPTHTFKAHPKAAKVTKYKGR
uniref:Small ribosomal subunit protein uS19c n=1 Tax=Alexandrium andersonii TaxID=327968 RepID=A0A7S2GVR4_9DINO|mmetsp:Transcript_64375/g.144740  ORF Transcript_64375/g.144740 Transcript_64375/m.144740 type:complete len:184 (+) Transcript_64375:63-614(+)